MAVAATLVPTPLIDELVAICGDGPRLHRQVRAVQPRARAGPVPGAPVGGPHPAGGRAADLAPSRSPRSSSSRTATAIPVVPRAGGTGLTDGAVPLQHGILVDVKLMNQILEIDLEDRTVTVQPGHQHAQAQRGAAAARLHLSRTTRRPTRARSSAAGSARAAGR